MKEPQVSIGGWIDEQNVVDPGHGISFSLKKEGDSDTFYNMGSILGPGESHMPWGS